MLDNRAVMLICSGSSGPMAAPLPPYNPRCLSLWPHSALHRAGSQHRQRVCMLPASMSSTPATSPHLTNSPLSSEAASLMCVLASRCAYHTIHTVHGPTEGLCSLLTIRQSCGSDLFG